MQRAIFFLSFEQSAVNLYVDQALHLFCIFYADHKFEMQYILQKILDWFGFSATTKYFSTLINFIVRLKNICDRSIQP